LRPTGAVLIHAPDIVDGLPKKEPSEFVGCSQFCNCPSTQEPQGSTGIGSHPVNISIKSTYFYSISTGFHKLPDLFWDRWIAIFNYFIINNLYKVLRRVSIASTSHCGFLNAGFWELRARFCEEIPVNRLLGFLPNHSSKKLSD
jgi:hypothetical protein